MKRSIVCLAGIVLLMLNSPASLAQNVAEATRLSYAGKYEEAEQVFVKLIAADERNTGLLTASGFNNAWGKNYDAARNRFLKALQLEPANTDALKGLAYVQLYEGRYAKAARAFDELIRSGPRQEEFYVAAGLACLNMQRPGKAYRHFESALQLNTANADARKYSAVINSRKGILELSTLAGFSRSEALNRFGLRQVQAGYHINAGNFIYVRYDNSLSQDNYFLLKNKDRANALSAGFYSRWHRVIGSRFEYGYITLPQRIRQQLYQTEQVIFLPANFYIKLGGSAIFSDQLADEWMLMGAVSVPAGKKIRIEPYYYLIQRLYKEHRLLLNLNCTFSPKADLTAGVFNGTEKNIKTQTTAHVFGLYAYSNFRISGPLSGLLLSRYEKDAFGRKTFIAAGGLKLSVDTKKH